MKTYRNFFLVATVLLAFSLILNIVQNQESNRLRRGNAMKSAIISNYESDAKAAADRARARKPLVETSSFRIEPYYESTNSIETHFRNQLVKWRQEFPKGYENVARKGILDDRVEKVAKKICELEGIKYVSFGSYQMTVGWAEMFTWDELKGPIIEILKTEFLDPAHPPAGT